MGPRDGGTSSRFRRCHMGNSKVSLVAATHGRHVCAPVHQGDEP